MSQRVDNPDQERTSGSTGVPAQQTDSEEREPQPAPLRPHSAKPASAPVPAPAPLVPAQPLPIVVGGQEPGSRLFPYFSFNLTLILALGVAASAWLIHFSDRFREVGEVLALGGLASWLAFVSRAISETRIKLF